MGALLSIILPALAPAFMDGIRGLFAKLTGGAGGNPQNVTERIQLMQAQAENTRAMADLDRPIGETSKWVNDFRAVFRYIAILLIWVLTAVVILVPSEVVTMSIKQTMLDIAGATLSFIIGERFYFNLKNKM